MNEINEKISRGYELLDSENVTEACEEWIEAWDGLTLYIDKVKVKSIEELEKDFEKGVENLSDWVQDLEMELENAGFEDSSFFIKRSVYVREFCNRLPDSDQFIIMSMKLAEAESYFELEDMERSEQLFSSTLEKYKNSIWPYLKWGDVYCLSSILRRKKEYMDIDKALDIYRRGLGKESDLDYILIDRIEDLEKAAKAMK